MDSNFYEKKLTLTIVIPTFNEKENIYLIISKLEETLVGINFKILFVDDNSTDGTIEEIRQIALVKPYVSLLLRIGRRGLAGACIEGLLTAKSDFVAVMDCDLQHEETKLVEMLQKFNNDKELDLVVGTRHLNDGSSEEGFNKARQLGSTIATRITNYILKLNTSDPMSGFFMVRQSSVIPIATKLQPEGFKILADMIASSQGKWKIDEVAYNFKKRLKGESKMEPAVAFELLGLLISHLTFGFLSLRFVLFLMVGFSGIFIQLFFTWIAFSLFEFSFLTAQSAGVIFAMTTNFYLNNLLTYKDRSLSGFKFLKGLVSFYLVCSVGAVCNVAIAKMTFEILAIWQIASLVGATVGAVWNFFFSSIFTWKVR